MAFVPSRTEINMVPIDDCHPNFENAPNKRVTATKLYSGFASEAVACVYRPRYQHVSFDSRIF